MRILHLCLGNFFIDNCSYQENMLPKYHVKQGHDVMVIASLFTYDEKGRESRLPKASSYIDPSGFRVTRLEYRSPVKWGSFFRHFKGLYAAIESFCPDVIFSHNVSYGDTGVVARYIRRHPGTRLFADNHADYVNSAKNMLSRKILHPVIWRHYAGKLVPYMEKCYGVIPMRCRFLKEMYKIPGSIVQFLPLGVDDDLIPADRDAVRSAVRKELGIPQGVFMIMTGGKIDRLKNTHVLIQAMEELANPNVHLVICGVLTPDMEYLSESIRRNPNIHYLGWCDARRVMDCMVAADLVCFPGTHSTLWEQAVGLGLPAIFKHWNEIDHVGVNGNCLFVKGEDPEELKSVISSLLDAQTYAGMKALAVLASKSFQYSEIARKAID